MNPHAHRPLCRPACLRLAPVLLPQTAAAQTAPAAARSSARPPQLQTAAPASTAPPHGAAPSSQYIAKQTTTRVQTLADGTHITTVTTAQIWRDADGRLRTETINTPANGTQSRFISIYDPVARVRMSWTVAIPTWLKLYGLSLFAASRATFASRSPNRPALLP